MLDLESKPVSKHQDKMKVPYSSPRNWSSLTTRGMTFLFPGLWALDAGGFPPLYLVPIRFSTRPFGGLPLDAPHAPQVTHLLPVPHRRCFLFLQGLPCLLGAYTTKTRNSLAFGHSCIPRAWRSENALGVSCGHLWNLWMALSLLLPSIFILLGSQTYVRKLLDQS